MSKSIQIHEPVLEQVCVFVIFKSQEPDVVRLDVEEDVLSLIREFVVRRFTTSLKGVRSFDLQAGSVGKELLEMTKERAGDLCEHAFALSRRYRETLRSRSSLVIFAKFTLESRRFVGLFQLREIAVMALFPERKELKVIQQAFRRFEKAIVTPSLATKYEVEIFQKSKAEYFEKFVGIDRPPTVEESLEAVVKSNKMKFSDLLDFCSEHPEAKQALIKLDLGDSVTTVKLGELLDILGTSGVSFVLVKTSPEAKLRIRTARIEVDSQAVHQVRDLLKKRNLI